MLLRQKFNVEIVEQTIIHITADDYYKLYINGEFITQGPAPAYPFRYYYNSIDITWVLHPGENTIAIHTYYQGRIIVDFGAIYVGYLFLSATGASGAQIKLRVAQELNTDGTVRSEMRCN